MPVNLADSFSPPYAGTFSKFFLLHATFSRISCLIMYVMYCSPFLKVSLRNTFEFLWRIFLEKFMRFFDKLLQALRNVLG